MLYVNLGDHMEAGQFYLGIPCACVGIIVFWVHVVHIGEKGFAAKDYRLPADDEIGIKKTGKEHHSMTFLRWISSICEKRKEHPYPPSGCNPIIKQKSYRVKYRYNSRDNQM